MKRSAPTPPVSTPSGIRRALPRPACLTALICTSRPPVSERGRGGTGKGPRPPLDPPTQDQLLAALPRQNGTPKARADV